MTYFNNLKDQVRSNILNVNYAPPKNPIAYIKYHALVKEVITEMYNEYLESPVKVYMFASRLPYDMYYTIARTAGWNAFLKRIHISDFSLLYREIYGIYGVNKCTCDDCKRVLENRKFRPMDNAPYMSSMGSTYFEPQEYLNRKAQLEKMSKTERLVQHIHDNSYFGAPGKTKPVLIVGLENDISEKIREMDIQWIQNLKASEPLTANDLTCPHAKAMLFTKAKTKKGN